MIIVVCVCVSEEKQGNLVLLAVDCVLPTVTLQQLLAEIKRRNLTLKQEDIPLLLDFLLQQSSPYSLFDAQPESWFAKGLWK